MSREDAHHEGRTASERAGHGLSNSSGLGRRQRWRRSQHPYAPQAWEKLQSDPMRGSLCVFAISHLHRERRPGADLPIFYQMKGAGGAVPGEHVARLPLDQTSVSQQAARAITTTAAAEQRQGHSRSGAVWACEARLAQPPHGAQLLISLAHPHNHGQLGLEPRHFSCSYRTDFALLASFCCFLCVYPQGGPGQLRRPEIAERGAPCPFRCSPRWQGRLAGRGEPRERGRTGGRPPCARSPPPTAPPPQPEKPGGEPRGRRPRGGQARTAGIQRCLLARYRRRPPPGGAWDQNEGKDAAAAAGDAEGRLGRSHQIAIFDGYLRYEDRNIVAKPRNDFERSQSWLFKSSLFVQFHMGGQSW